MIPQAHLVCHGVSGRVKARKDGCQSRFTDDAVISNAIGIHRGIDAIRRNYIDFVAKRKFGFHFVTNMTICLAESRQEAVSTSYLVTLNVKNDGQLALVARSYIDQFRKTGDNWKFSDGESQQTSDQPWTAIDA